MKMLRARSLIAMASALAAVCCATGAVAADTARSAFGRTRDGQAVEAVTLTSRGGMRATIISYGATLQELVVPDPAGRPADVVLGYGDVAAYETAANYFGASVGRYANRIANGAFTIDGRSYRLARNDNGAASLHGGAKGFDKKVWTISKVESGATAAVELTLVSPDGDEGYPGELKVTARYAMSDDNALTIQYRAISDKPTVVNLVNHALYNMAGEGAPGGALGNRLQLNADSYLPVDSRLIPSGAKVSVAGGAFDFRRPTQIAARIRNASEPQLLLGRGYDHCFALPAAAGVRLAAVLSDPESERALEFWTDQPGMQFYSGNFIDATTAGKGGAIYRQGDGVALEAQRFPDAPNQPNLGEARLAPGQTYSSTLILKARGQSATPVARSQPAF